MEESLIEDDAPSLTRFRARLDSFKHISPARGRSKTFCTPRKVGMLDNCDEETPSTSQTERELCSTDEENNELPVLGTHSRRSRVTVTEVSDDTPPRTRKPRKRPKRGYAPPEVYEHLDMLQDHLGRYLDGMYLESWRIIISRSSRWM
ncbi:hypothetical protein PHLCEN_2v3148 [Hermanssonia centrifuga]|uniref:Uncharacterized protein n=1 Tax=Hermanssonia centrifuga TaxID=98765 RepID=A0A2R6R120_9APHY|nr:hypothetical protein PHLCEN_2v3148 [Hermanssonia centrifuga]